MRKIKIKEKSNKGILKTITKNKNGRVAETVEPNTVVPIII